MKRVEWNFNLLIPDKCKSIIAKTMGINLSGCTVTFTRNVTLTWKLACDKLSAN